MILSDKEIKQLATEQGMISPFVDHIVREMVGRKVISYGLSSYGYDIRLSSAEFVVFQHVPGTVVNPKKFSAKNLKPVALQSDEDGEYFVIPGHSYGLGVALECLQVPNDVTIICIGKSTYARCGLVANLTPAEAGWCGHLTLEISNSSSTDCRVYANEGICQLLFFRGEPCQTTYEDRAGKYQGQGQSVTLAKV